MHEALGSTHNAAIKIKQTILQYLGFCVYHRFGSVLFGFANTRNGPLAPCRPGKHSATELHPSPMIPDSLVEKLKHDQVPG